MFFFLIPEKEENSKIHVIVEIIQNVLKRFTTDEFERLIFANNSNRTIFTSQNVLFIFAERFIQSQQSVFNQGLFRTLRKFFEFLLQIGFCRLRSSTNRLSVIVEIICRRRSFKKMRSSFLVFCGGKKKEIK